MKNVRPPLGGIFLLALCLGQGGHAQPPYLHAPAINEYAKHDPAGLTITPEGRFLKPLGRHTPLAAWPHGMALSPDGKTVFVASEGVGQLVTDWDGPSPTVTPVIPENAGAAKRRTNAGGVAFSKDSQTLYWSSGETGGVFFFDVASKQKTAEVSLNGEFRGRKFEDSFAMDVKLSEDGSYLYCADVTNFRVAIVDIAQKQVVGSIPVGRYPYALAVTGKTVCVANIGVFEYSPIPPPKDPKFDKRGLTRPAFGFPSKEAKEGVEFEGRQVPGLGEHNTVESFSVWTIDASNPAQPRVTQRIKTGLLMGAPSEKGKTIGGSAPNFVLTQGDRLYVSNYNNDLIERWSLTTGKRLWRTRLVPSPLVAKLRGVGPCGMALSADGKRLYVTEAGINAIAVLDGSSGKALGHLPTTWYPYRVTLSPDGKQLLYIGFRGFGNGPNAGGERPANNPFLGFKGSLTVLDLPTENTLPAHTANVLAYNGIVDKSANRAKMSSPLIPTIPGQVSQEIKYVVFITKENHTFDCVFDRVPGAKHDPSLLRWGYHQTITSPNQPTLEDVAVMTNHNALARQFTVSDNFYMQPEASGVGHRWLVGVQPNNFCQMTYTLGWDFKVNSTAPGRRASFGSNGSIAPEDYPEAGTMWHHLANHGLGFRNYGEGFEFAGVLEDDDQIPTGAREVVNIPMPKVVYDNTCFDFPIFNMNIPDQYRADWFIKDFTNRYLPNAKRTAKRGKNGKRLASNQRPAKPLPCPPFINIAICNDHGTEPNPKKGYPYRASWMADNDLALGRIVDFLSHTPYWKNMAIFVTQDDSGGEPDHVDGQRSVLLVISPWAKRANVSHRHTTILSMHRTLYQIFGLPPLNLFDALANDFADCFTERPDFTPYTHVPVDKRIFDPAKAKDPKDPDYKQARRMPSIPMDDPDEMDANLHRKQ